MLIPASLGVWFCCEHGSSLTLHVLGLGLFLFWVGSQEFEEGKASFLSPGALGHLVE